MLKKLMLAGVAIGSLAIMSGAQATTLTIDDFAWGFAYRSQGGSNGNSNPDFTENFEVKAHINPTGAPAPTDTDNSYGFVQAPVSSILGGEREVWVNVTRPTTGTIPTGAGASTAKAGGGTFTHNQDSQFFGYSVMTWDGSGDVSFTDELDESTWTGVGSGVGTAGVDFGLDADLSLFSAFELAMVALEHEAKLTLSVWDQSQKLAQFSDTFDPFNGTLAINYNQMAIDAGFDWEHVSAIQLYMDGTIALSFDLSSGTFSAVPEPISVGLFGLGLLGLAGARRRRVA